MDSLAETESAELEVAKYLIIGQGDIGLAVTNELAAQGNRVVGLARGAHEQYDLHPEAGFVQADALALSANHIEDVTHLAIIVTPDNYQAENYKNTYLGIAKHIAALEKQLPKLDRVVFISSTGVYGQDNGEWIDETVSPSLPKREGSKYIFQAEQVLQAAYGKRAIVIRASGIYGKQRLMRVRKAQESDKPAMSADAWTNRVMDSDLVNIVVQVLTGDAAQLKPLYLATDYAPVTSLQLTQWLCAQLGSQPPEASAENKVSGKRLHSNIPRDWLQYPDWQSGYKTILADLH